MFWGEGRGVGGKGGTGVGWAQGGKLVPTMAMGRGLTKHLRIVVCWGVGRTGAGQVREWRERPRWVSKAQTSRREERLGEKHGSPPKAPKDDLHWACGSGGEQRPGARGRGSASWVGGMGGSWEGKMVLAPVTGVHINLRFEEHSNATAALPLYSGPHLP